MLTGERWVLGGRSMQWNSPIGATSSGLCFALMAAMTLSTSGCARTASNEQQADSAVSESVKTGRTLNGHTYTDTPVDVKLGPNTFRIPANYLDSQIAPWLGEGVTLIFEWPDMVPTEPGARAHPRTNDFRKEISILVDYVDRLPIKSSLDRHASNDLTAEAGSLERRDPRERLDLRLPQAEWMGLTPYALDETRMSAYIKELESRDGRPYQRNPALEPDWYVVQDPTGSVTTLIRCDSEAESGDGVRIEGRDIVNIPDSTVASCRHQISDVANSLSIRISYNRVFLKDWKNIEDAVRQLLTQYKVG